MASLPSTSEAEDMKEKEEKSSVTVEKVNEKETKSATYASKKAVAQRMMDIALLTSNANQLRYVLHFGSTSAQFAIAVALIALSLALQVAVGIFLIFRMKSNSTPLEKERIHSFVVGGVFLITIVNVLASAFSIGDAPLELGAPALNNVKLVNPSDQVSFQPKITDVPE